MHPISHLMPGLTMSFFRDGRLVGQAHDLGNQAISEFTGPPESAGYNEIVIHTAAEHPDRIDTSWRRREVQGWGDVWVTPEAGDGDDRMPAGSILLSRDMGMGDLIMLEPVLRELHQRGYYTALACNRDLMCLFDGNPDVDRITPLEVQPWPRSDHWVELRWRVDWITEHPLFSHRHRTEVFADVIRGELGLDELELSDPRPRLFVPEDARAWAATILPRAPFAVVHTHSMASLRTYRRMGIVIDELSRRMPVVLVSHVPTMAPRTKGEVINLTGAIPVMHLAAVIERAAVVIGNDSGCVHMAGALGVPFVALFGHYDPRLRLQYYSRYRVLRGRPFCQYCWEAFNYCGRNDFSPCLEEIHPAQVVSAALDVMREPPVNPTVDPSVSVIIPVHGHRDLTEAAVAGIRADCPKAEIIIVDGASPDDTAEWAEGQGLKVIRLDSNRGVAAAINAGMTVAGGEVIVRVDNDVTVTPGGFRAIVQAALANGLVGVTGGIFNDRMEYERSTLHAFEADYIEGYLIAFRRDVWGVLGEFDEGFGLGYGEDVDWSFRAAKNGVTFNLCPFAITHIGQQTARGIDMGDTISRNMQRLRDRWRTWFDTRPKKLPLEWYSETARIRQHVLRFLGGVGLDLGPGKDPIDARAIRVDSDPRVPAHILGDARKLPWFADDSIDYLYSSHLLDKYEEWEEILPEWARVVKPGGKMILVLPDKNRWATAVANGQAEEPARKRATSPGELSGLFGSWGGWRIIEDRFADAFSYNVLFVAMKEEGAAGP